MRISDWSSDVCSSDLSAQFGRVSNERLVCGPGLVNIHRALSEIAGVDPGPMQPADITAGAAAGDPRRMRATDVFCAVFRAIAGDLVVDTAAWAGVFLPTSDTRRDGKQVVGPF